MRTDLSQEGGSLFIAFFCGSLTPLKLSFWCVDGFVKTTILPPIRLVSVLYVRLQGDITSLSSHIVTSLIQPFHRPQWLPQDLQRRHHPLSPQLWS